MKRYDNFGVTVCVSDSVEGGETGEQVLGTTQTAAAQRAEGQSEEPAATYRLHQLLVRKVERHPHPGLVVAHVGRERYSSVQEVVGDDLHGLLLPHQHSNAVVLLVLQEPHVPHAPLSPGLQACALVQQSLSVHKQLSAPTYVCVWGGRRERGQ
jgi:hypothetical protein